MVRPVLVSLLALIVSCVETAPPPPRPAAALPTTTPGPPAPVVPVELHAQAWEQLCGGRLPDPKGRCQLIGIDEDDDGSVLVAGGWEGTGSLFGKEATSTGYRSMVLARFSGEGQLVWSKLVGRTRSTGSAINHASLVLALGGGTFAIAGAHGAGFDLGSGELPMGPPNTGGRDAFLALLRRDGSPIFAGDLDTLVFGAPRSRPVDELRPFGLHSDGAGGVWVLAARPDGPLAAAHVAANGAFVERAQYPVLVRLDGLHDKIAFRSADGADRLLAGFDLALQRPESAMAVTPDGSLLLADPAPDFSRGLLLHRFGKTGSAWTVSLDTERPPLSWWRAHLAAGSKGEVYVAASTTALESKQVILGGTVVPRLLQSFSFVHRVEPDGKVAWSWKAGPREGFVTAMAATLTGPRLRVTLAHRDDLVVSPAARAPSPEKLGLDSVGTPGLSVVTFDLEGRPQSVDTLTSQGDCPTWTPQIAFVAVARSKLSLLSPARDVETGKPCAIGFGFHGGYVVASVPLK